MSIIAVVISLMVVGVLLWVINTYIPMDARIKQLINIFVVVCVVLWLLQIFGVFSLLQAPVPRVD